MLYQKKEQQRRPRSSCAQMKVGLKLGNCERATKKIQNSYIKKAQSILLMLHVIKRRKAFTIFMCYKMHWNMLQVCVKSTYAWQHLISSTFWNKPRQHAITLFVESSWYDVPCTSDWNLGLLWSKSRVSTFSLNRNTTPGTTVKPDILASLKFGFFWGGGDFCNVRFLQICIISF